MSIASSSQPTRAAKSLANLPQGLAPLTGHIIPTDSHLLLMPPKR